MVFTSQANPGLDNSFSVRGKQLQTITSTTVVMQSSEHEMVDAVPCGGLKKSTLFQSLVTDIDSDERDFGFQTA